MSPSFPSSLPSPRLTGAVTALLAAWSLVAALLVLGTAALALLVSPTAGVLALVVGVAALAVPGLLAGAAFALLTGRGEAPALVVAAAVVSALVAAVGVVGPGLPGHVEVVAGVAVLVAVVVVAPVVAGRAPLVAPPALLRAATVGTALLLAAYGLAMLVLAPLAVATPSVIALVTAGVAAWAWRAPASAAGSLTTAATALSLLLTVLAVRTGLDPLPAVVALGVLGPVAVGHAPRSLRMPMITRMPTA